MSEADISNNRDLSDSGHSSNPIHATDTAKGDRVGAVAAVRDLPESSNAATDLSAAQQLPLKTDQPTASQPGDFCHLNASPNSNGDRELLVRDVPVEDPIALIQQLQQDNCNLLKRVALLESVLEECQNALQSQLARSEQQDSSIAQHGQELAAAQTQAARQDALIAQQTQELVAAQTQATRQDTLIAQQTQELAVAQEQATRLLHELESAQKLAQRQQVLIETLTEQLENAQERVVYLEQQCALTQQHYSEQSKKLVETESVHRELRSRLQRQQRQTLQFKAALEKCLDVAVPNRELEQQLEPQTNGFALSESIDLDLNLHANLQSFLPKGQPIQPWSAEPQLPALDRTCDPDSTAQPQLQDSSPPLPSPSVMANWVASDVAVEMSQSGSDSPNSDSPNRDPLANNSRKVESVDVVTVDAHSLPQSDIEFALTNEAILPHPTQNKMTGPTQAEINVEPELVPLLNNRLEVLANQLLADLLKSAEPDELLSSEAAHPERSSLISSTEDESNSVLPGKGLMLPKWHQSSEPLNVFADRIEDPLVCPLTDMPEAEDIGTSTKHQTADKAGLDSGIEFLSLVPEEAIEAFASTPSSDAAESAGMEGEQTSSTESNIELSLSIIEDSATTKSVSPSAAAGLEVQVQDPVAASVPSLSQEISYPVEAPQSNPDFVSTSSPSEALPARNATPSLSSTTHSPSPLVYPLRPPKGRKSLSAVELPSFLR